MRQDLYARITELKATADALTDDLVESGLHEEDPIVELVNSLISDEILFLRGIIKKLETH